jgi:hypothetical protein
MSLGPIVVDPSANEFFSIYWGDRFSSISSGTWTVSGGTTVTLSGSTVIGSTSTGVFGTGFEAGGIYTLSSRVTSGDGQVDERSIVFRCENL